MLRVQHRSPSLTAIFNALKLGQKVHVLDLGSCDPVNYTFFYPFSLRVQYANFDENLAHNVQLSTEEFKCHIESFFSGLNESRKFDVVLGWDILNFMSLEQIVIFFDVLKTFVNTDALIYFLLYTGTHSVKPNKFKINDQYTVSVSSLSDQEFFRDNLTSVGLLKSLPNYYMLRNYRNLYGMMPGLVEHIFCFNPHSVYQRRELPAAEITDADMLVETNLYSPSINMLRSTASQQHVLDLSKKNILNEDVWRRYFVNVTFDDLPSVMGKLRCLTVDDVDTYLSTSTFLNLSPDKKFDVVVLWDLLTFVSLEFAEELGRRVERYCHDGTLLIVMMHTGLMIPESPLPLLLTQSGIGIDARKKPKDIQRSKLPLSSYQIQKAFPNFYIQETFGARVGMYKGITEYVFVYKDAATLAREKNALKEQVVARREKLGLKAL